MIVLTSNLNDPNPLLGVVFLLLFLVFYFLPFTIAACRKHRNIAAIFVIDFFLGWTLIGWVVALAWALSYQEAIRS